jgi:dolichol kinase
LIIGAVLVAAIFMLPRPWLLGAGVTWVVVFGLLSRRLSTAVVGLLIVNLLSASRLVTLGAAVVFVAGDALSALVGTAFPVGRWPWNPRKTASGSVAFLVFGGLALAWLLWQMTGMPATQLVIGSVLPALVAAIAELTPWVAVADWRDAAPDDNLAVTVAAGATLAVLLALFGIAG